MIWKINPCLWKIRTWLLLSLSIPLGTHIIQALMDTDVIIKEFLTFQAAPYHMVLEFLPVDR